MTTSKVVDHDAEKATTTIDVEMVRGDDLISSHQLLDGLASAVPVPNVLKIDVEGFEYDVLQGGQRILQNSVLRTVGVEMHFAELAKRGQKNAPRCIEDMLSGNRFNVVWTDHSHIVASRHHG